MATPTTPPYSAKTLVEDFYKAHFMQEDDEEDYEEGNKVWENDDEVGLMDYRQNDITVQEKDRTIIVCLDFSFNERDDCDIPIPTDFAEKWCAKFDAMEVAQDICFEQFEILKAFWEGTKLYIIINNLEELYTPEEVAEDFETESLEDGPYEGCPGESFWVVSYEDIQKAAALDEQAEK